MIESSSTFRSRWLLPAFYLALLAGGTLLFLLIRSVGETETPVGAAIPSGATAPSAHNVVLLHVLATITAVIVLGRLLARVFHYLGQPAVIGEVVAGILLGPSVLGAISPSAMHLLIPDAAADPHGRVLAALGTISQLGIVLYMFIVGLELNTKMLVKSAHAAVAISHASIVVPFVAGAGLALWLYPHFAPAGIPFTSFALFLGVAMAITAFPVLARILTDRGLDKTPLGVVALSCAATDDVTAWCLLAFVVGVAQANVSGAISIVIWAAIYIAAMLFVIRPLAVRYLQRGDGRIPAGTIPGLFIAVLASALTTEAIGIHAVFGGFLLGVIIPHDSPISRAVKLKLHDVVTMLLLPAFFAITGMNTRIGLISGWDNWLVCGAIILVATLGKFGGTLVAAQLAGINLRTSAALGVLMNTRGLMELIVLNIGLSLGVISPTLYAMMVLMALVTTMTTGPLLAVLWPKSDDEASDETPAAAAAVAIVHES
ncbi:cation:proton antiporter domain-containing protein [Planctomicrobium piriforme]|uniref:Kef-type K+ transport system, membrane component KefB n=1 Tax=Planctomicrobium piriforme TaxID=1576369 RepID=A0A1I3BB39_9PLAN|nr:cation:proton antiporter [Planctomicrobium piriforme]SFH59494.1 Kef-type K+ transport system, membrane component KefB [Planctomicrobium piriforme]